MAPFTAAAGRWVFPGGMPDPDDISSARMLDFACNVGRELLEETGLDIGACEVDPGWTLVRDGGNAVLVKRVTVKESAEQLHANVMHHVTNEVQPEFTAIRIVRRPADLDPATHRFFVQYLMAEWS
jgi:8-oxo-dGTP pyrophosphatase MutT (NUDIX family)